MYHDISIVSEHFFFLNHCTWLKANSPLKEILWWQTEGQQSIFQARPLSSSNEVIAVKYVQTSSRFSVCCSILFRHIKKKKKKVLNWWLFLHLPGNVNVVYLSSVQLLYIEEQYPTVPFFLTVSCSTTKTAGERLKDTNFVH